MRRRTTTPSLPRPRGFSLVEMLIALTISSVLLTSTLVAFDSMFKVYDTATNSASNHVVARIAIDRMLGMIRTGSDFGPFPANVLDENANPLAADYFEFASETDPATGTITQITRVEFRFQGQGALYRTWPADGPAPAPPDGAVLPGELWLVLVDPATAEEQEFLLLSDVRSAVFSLEYDVGPRLIAATIDITFEPGLASDGNVWTPATPEAVRLVASAMPRRSLR